TLGRDFGRLHPELRRRFGIGSTGERACIGTGTMDEVWRGRGVAPFLHLGATRNLLFPETGREVPFTIENYAYRDDLGRETVTFLRTFVVAPGRRRRFDATMVHQAGRLVDFLGTHQHVAADLHLTVEEGALVIRTGAFRIRGRRLPHALAADATVRESFDDTAGCFRIAVRVTNPLVGPVFGYSGRFTARYPELAAVPAVARPYREELRV
uniref:DUF4166 domain-containing protein n=1 Tax=Pseudonocardia pini TaxID=2758030 RepID=UPI0015F117ED